MIKTHFKNRIKTKMLLRINKITKKFKILKNKKNLMSKIIMFKYRNNSKSIKNQWIILNV